MPWLRCKLAYKPAARRTCVRTRVFSRPIGFPMHTNAPRGIPVVVHNNMIFEPRRCLRSGTFPPSFFLSSFFSLFFYRGPTRRSCLVVSSRVTSLVGSLVEITYLWWMMDLCGKKRKEKKKKEKKEEVYTWKYIYTAWNMCVMCVRDKYISSNLVDSYLSGILRIIYIYFW